MSHLLKIYMCKGVNLSFCKYDREYFTCDEMHMNAFLGSNLLKVIDPFLTMHMGYLET